MRRSRSAGRVAALFVAGAVLVVVATVVAVTARGQATVGLEISVPSPSLGGKLHAVVVLPPGYRTSGKRYPVVTFLHGLPASPYSYRGVGFLQRALSQLPEQAILVAPQGARDGDGDSEYLDLGAGRNWETAVARDLPRYLDSRYRTIPNRKARALIGLSAGGYGAMLVALHHLDDYAVIESWSGYFHPTDPSGTHTRDLGSDQANARANAHRLVAMLHADETHRRTFLAFYVGSSDKRFRQENIRFDEELTAARVPHLFRIYPGGHESAVWNAHAVEWLGLALRHLEAAR